MKEQDYQRKIAKRFEESGYEVLNLIKTNKNGIPDLVALKPTEVVFIECKTPKGKLSKIQEYRLSKLVAQGFECYVSYGDDLKIFVPHNNLEQLF